MRQTIPTLRCKFTAPALRRRKATVIAQLSSLVIEKQETVHGFRYKFANTDKALDWIVDFIKSEKQCGEFFTFSLERSETEKTLWLIVSGRCERVYSPGNRFVK